MIPPILPKKPPPHMPHAKALIFAGVILGACLFLSFAISIPASTDTRISGLLRNAGFDHVKIDDIDYRLSGVTAHGLTLDREGYDRLNKLDIDLSWPSFLMSGAVKSVSINGLHLTRPANETRLLLQESLSNLLKLPDHRLVIEDAVLDTATVYGDLRIVIDATIERPAEDGARSITAGITANQYQLGFDSRWSGTIGADGTLDIGADLVDGRLHFGPVAVTRMSGWVGLTAGMNALSLQSQIEAGGAELFGAPMQGFSVVTDLSANAGTLLVRSEMAGLNDTGLSIDMTTARAETALSFVVKGSNLDAFAKRLAASEKNGRKIPAAFQQQAPFMFAANYQPERRFAGGPMPFALHAEAGGISKMTGNFLIYPGNFDLRGSAETDPTFAAALRDFLKIDADKISGKFIRLDGNIADALGIEIKPDAAAGHTETEQAFPDQG